MVCTYCGSETQVINSRHQKRGNNVWRRRKCTVCGAVFSTSEQIDYEKTWAVQSKDGRISPFLRDKLFISIHKSVQHRPAALQDAIGLTSTVINAVAHKVTNGAVRTEDIAEITLLTLRRFDQPAAISYQAFHTDVV
jgi:transcriptional repressor NrdR